MNIPKKPISEKVANKRHRKKEDVIIINLKNGCILVKRLTKNKYYYGLTFIRKITSKQCIDAFCLGVISITDHKKNTSKITYAPFSVKYKIFDERRYSTAMTLIEILKTLPRKFPKSYWDEYKKTLYTSTKNIIEIKLSNENDDDEFIVTIPEECYPTNKDTEIDLLQRMGQAYIAMRDKNDK